MGATSGVNGFLSSQSGPNRAHPGRQKAITRACGAQTPGLRTEHANGESAWHSGILPATRRIADLKSLSESIQTSLPGSSSSTTGTRPKHSRAISSIVSRRVVFERDCEWAVHKLANSLRVWLVTVQQIALAYHAQQLLLLVNYRKAMVCSSRSTPTNLGTNLRGPDIGGGGGPAPALLLLVLSDVLFIVYRLGS